MRILVQIETEYGAFDTQEIVLAINKAVDEFYERYATAGRLAIYIDDDLMEVNHYEIE